jgi:hypothetical protein
MSKGYGVVQRRILAQLAQSAEHDPQAWTPLSELVDYSDRSRSDRSQYNSVLQAIHALRDGDVVETRHIAGKPGYRDGSWQTGHWRLYVRLWETP